MLLAAFAAGFIKAPSFVGELFMKHKKPTDSDGSVRFEIGEDGTIIRNDCEEKSESANASTAIIPNIMEIIDAHISARDEHSGGIVSTTLGLGGHCRLISNPQTELMLEMVFEQGNLKEQLEKERFRKSRYYSFFANESNNSYTLILNTGKEAVAEILVEILTTVYDHPKGKALDTPRNLPADAIPPIPQGGGTGGLL